MIQKQNLMRTKLKKNEGYEPPQEKPPISLYENSPFTFNKCQVTKCSKYHPALNFDDASHIILMAVIEHTEIFQECFEGRTPKLDVKNPFLQSN